MNLTQWSEIASIISCIISIISLFISIKALSEIINIKISISNGEKQSNNAKSNFKSDIKQSNIIRKWGMNGKQK